MQVKYIECECKDASHVLRFVYDFETDDSYPPELYAEVHLRHYRPFWKRILNAIRYVAGFKSRYGDFDCTLIGKDEATRLQNLLKEYTKAYREWEKAQNG